MVNISIVINKGNEYDLPSSKRLQSANWKITMWKIGKSTIYNVPCSIAMNHQRVPFSDGMENMFFFAMGCWGILRQTLEMHGSLLLDAFLWDSNLFHRHNYPLVI